VGNRESMTWRRLMLRSIAYTRCPRHVTFRLLNISVPFGNN